ncbi:unnamed protein product [Dicrocoelium dendriticum]|nr:unnamed protein product [Dicrocoelium dendriticum]
MSISIPIETFQSRYRCCNCLHVRTGTLLLAIFQIIIHFVVIAILTAALGRSTRLRDDVEYVALSVSVMSFIQWERFTAEPINPPTFRKVITTPDPLHPLPAEHAIEASVQSTTVRPGQYTRTVKFFMNAGEEYVAIAVTLLSLLFSIMMLIGTIYCRPYYLLPYCCVQFLDLFVTSLSVVGYYTYLPETGALTRPRLALSIVVILAGILLLGLKAYMLGIVWLCYKFLLRLSAGLEQGTGFSFAAGSLPLSNSLCRRLGLNHYVTDSRPPTHSPPGDRGLLSASLTGRSRPSSRRIVMLFRGPTSHSVTTASGEVVSEDPCMPPKYEDVLAMPSNAYGPPPYESIVEESAVTTQPNNLGESPSPTPASGVQEHNQGCEGAEQ